MKKILHVVNIPFVIPYFFGNQFKYMSGLGYEIHVISSDSNDLELYGYKYNFKSYSVAILRKISLIKDLQAVWKIYQYIRKNDIQIVVGHTPKGSLLSMIAAYLNKSKIRIYFRHGLVYETTNGLMRFILKTLDIFTAKLSTTVICVSPSLYKKSLQEKLNPINKQIILSKGTCNGIDLQKFNINVIDQVERVSLMKKYQIPEDAIVIGFCGRLVRDKGIIELIKSFISIQIKNADVYLLLVGEFESRDALPSNIIREIKSNDHIIITGFVDNEYVNLYYALMDIFVLPSYREGFPTSILEASSMCLPVITTRVTGCIDAIIENETGLFVGHDEKELENALLYLMQNKNVRDNFGHRGRDFVTNNFNQQIIWKEIEKLYH